jgi:hypothetical protein
MTDLIEDKAERLSRRGLLGRFGAAGLGVVGASLLAGCGGSSNGGHNGVSQTDVLNFALNLEYLEASFYSFAITGAGLSSGDLGGTPTITPVTQVSGLTAAQQAIFTEILNDEIAHVRDLRSALGSSAVPCPNLNLKAVGDTTSVDALITISRAFEDVGVTAYAGASTSLSGDNLQAAADILAVEAFHASNLRLQIAQLGLATAVVDPHAVVIKDILPPPTVTHYWATDANSLALNRNTSEVLAIVYGLGGAPTIGVNSGGFFPNGLNGRINTITTT